MTPLPGPLAPVLPGVRNRNVAAFKEFDQVTLVRFHHCLENFSGGLGLCDTAVFGDVRRANVGRGILLEDIPTLRNELLAIFIQPNPAPRRRGAHCGAWVRGEP